MKFKLQIISLIILSSSFLFVSCDKPTMYAVSNYNIDEYLNRYKLAVEKFEGGNMHKNDKKYIYSAFAGSNQDWKTYEKRLKEGPKELPVLYAYSNYNLNRYNLRVKEAKKQRLEQYARKAIPTNSMTLDATEYFYAASKHNINTFKKRIDEAVQQGIKKENQVLCYAMSEHNIDVFIKRYNEAESKFSEINEANPGE